ncbi:hypothetical protein B484DRAFT_214440, partial [Ochromonadaceae sp. CCMP2298]
VWDVASPGGPLYVLEGAGQPTCCCFSSTQSHLLLGATEEGALHLWDLRERASLHRDRDARDLQIAAGIRKPSYSTHLSFPTEGGEEQGGDELTWQHAAPVVQVESLGGDMSSVVSQFVSLDEAGLVIFWVSSQRENGPSSSSGSASGSSGSGAGSGAGAGSRAGVGGVAEDLQRSPWAGVALLQTRQIHTHANSLSRPLRTPSFGLGMGAGGAGGGAVVQGSVTLAPVPQDPGTLLVSAAAGQVLRLSRFGQAGPQLLGRGAASLEDLPAPPEDKDRGDKGAASTFFSAVTCIAVRPPAAGAGAGAVTDGPAEAKSETALPASTPASALVLVGRLDGSCDLFQLDQPTPLRSWDLPALAPYDRGGDNGGEKGDKGCRVVLLQWTARPAVFFAADQRGRLFHFDLLLKADGPVHVSGVGGGGPARQLRNRGAVDVSRPAPASGVFYVTAVAPAGEGEGGSGGESGEGDGGAQRLWVRRGNASIFRGSQSQEESLLRAALGSLCAVSRQALSVNFTKGKEDK